MIGRFTCRYARSPDDSPHKYPTIQSSNQFLHPSPNNPPQPSFNRYKTRSTYSPLLVFIRHDRDEWHKRNVSHGSNGSASAERSILYNGSEWAVIHVNSIARDESIDCSEVTDKHYFADEYGGDIHCFNNKYCSDEPRERSSQAGTGRDKSTGTKCSRDRGTKEDTG
jgi:hypothetical protein